MLRPTAETGPLRFAAVGLRAALIIGAGCSPSNSVPTDQPGAPQTASSEVKSAPLTVSSAFVFIPEWEGAEGFAAGVQYAIQGDAFNEDRTALSDGQRITGLPADGGPMVAFDVVGESLSDQTVAVQTAGPDGQRFTGDSTLLWVAYNGPEKGWHDWSNSRLITELDNTHRPEAEANHALKVAIDFNGDGKVDYAEFAHYCKAESAPFPLDDAARAEWDATNGPVDWDATCSNVHTIQAGQWNKVDRKTPM